MNKKEKKVFKKLSSSAFPATNSLGANLTVIDINSLVKLLSKDKELRNLISELDN